MDFINKKGIDYYGVLGLTKGATEEEIKEAYKRLSLQYNPIRNKKPDLEPLFCLIGEAYEVLADHRLKCIYDQFGEEGLKKGMATPFGWNPAWQYHGEPLRTFKKFFGTSNPYADLIYCMADELPFVKAKKMEDIKKKQPPYEQEIQLTLEEVYFGTTKKVKIQRRVYDKDRITTRLQEKVFSIHIKPGLPNGTRIIYRNVGDEGPSVIPGDLIITTKDSPHPRFRRDGVNLFMNVTLELHRSIGGLTIELTTIDKRIIRFAITDVIMPGYTKIIANEGMPYVDDNMKKGDLIILFDVEFPKYLTEATRKKIMTALAESGSPEDDMDSPEVENMVRVADKLKSMKKTSLAKQTAAKDLRPCEDFIEINKGYLFKI